MAWPRLLLAILTMSQFTMTKPWGYDDMGFCACHDTTGERNKGLINIGAGSTSQLQSIRDPHLMGASSPHR